MEEKEKKLIKDSERDDEVIVISFEDEEHYFKEYHDKLIRWIEESGSEFVIRNGHKTKKKKE